LVSVIAALAVMLAGTHARAAPRVAIVVMGAAETAGPGGSKPACPEPAQDALLSAAGGSLRAELEAAGFEVVTPDAESPRDLEGVAADSESLAAIALACAGNEARADVWVTDRVLGKTVIRHVHVDAALPDAGRILALRAVEVLHASLIELDLPRGRPREVPKSEATTSSPAEPAATPRATVAPPARDTGSEAEELPPGGKAPAEAGELSRYALDVGVGALGGPGDIPVSLPVPVARFSMRFVDRWLAQIVWNGPALSRVSARRADESSADLDQELLLLRLGFDPSASHFTLAPFAAAGFGVERIAARGRLDDTMTSGAYRAVSESKFVAVVNTGVGLRVRPWQRFAFVATADLVVALARPVIRLGETAAKAAEPMLVGAVSVEASW
jgi:hypothetical protein